MILQICASRFLSASTSTSTYPPQIARIRILVDPLEMKRRRRKSTTFWDDLVQQQRASKRARVLRTNFDNNNESDHPSNIHVSPPISPSSPPRLEPDPVLYFPYFPDHKAQECISDRVEKVLETMGTGASASDVMIDDSDTESKDDPEKDESVSIETITDHDELDLAFNIQPFEEEEENSDGLEIENNAGSQPSQITSAQMNRRRDDLASIEERLSMWEDDHLLTGLVAVVGSVRYTVDQYNFTREILEAGTSGKTLPAYSKTQRCFQDLIKYCLPSSHVLSIPRTCPGQGSSRIQSTTSSQNNGNHGDGGIPSTCERGEKNERVRVFLPSAWAKLDVETPFTFDLMFPGFLDGDPINEFSGLESSAVVQRREEMTNPCEFIYALQNDLYTPCRVVDVLSITLHDGEAPLGEAYDTYSSGSRHTLSAKILATWSVGSEGRPTSSSRKAVKLSCMTEAQRNLLNVLNTGQIPHVDLPDDEIHLSFLPGDICTMVSPENVITRHALILIHRFWRHEDGIPSITLAYVKHPTAEANIHSTAGGAIAVSKHVVRRLTLRGRLDLETTLNIRNRSRGTLGDGTPYVVYRILLYCDDFQKSSAMYPKGSAGGCYFLPLSFPPERRRNTSSVRIISLTPPWVSTNDVLRFIVDDLVNASVHGVDAYSPLGSPLKVFVDPVAFIGDYPASAEVVDVIGHVGSSPCTLCSFRRLYQTEASGSRYGYTTSVHSRNSAFLRHGERHTSLREANVPDADGNRLGMIPNERVSNGRCPLIHLQSEFENQRHSATVTEDVTPVLPCVFDAYRSNLIAPDHLLSGLSKDILNTVFNSFTSDADRKKSDALLCAALRENDLLRQNEVFNTRTRKIHSMTLSELFCVLLVSVPVTTMMSKTLPESHALRRSVTLLCKLQKLIALTYWWTEENVDGKKAVELIRNNKEIYFSDLRTLAKDYVRPVDDLSKRVPDVRQYLDKPNLHRLLELYEHTIPAFGHVREITELVFESAHQPLKRCISRSNNHNSHMYAVEHCVGNDWQGRLSAFRQMVTQAEEERKSTAQRGSYQATRTGVVARRGIRRIMLGEKASILNQELDKDFITAIDDTLIKQFRKAVISRFKKDNMISNFAAVKTSTWRGRGKSNVGDLSRSMCIPEASLKRIIRISKRWINAVLPAITSGHEKQPSITLFRYARRIKVGEMNSQIGKPMGYDTVYSNCIVQVNLVSSLSRKMVILSTQHHQPPESIYTWSWQCSREWKIFQLRFVTDA